MEVSKRCAVMQFSPIRRFNVFAFEAEREHGKKVYRLNIGQPDIETPPCFMDAIRKFDKKVIAYAESQGIDELRDAMIYYMKRDFNMEYERKDILITNGGSEALILAFTALLNPGDEALIAEPFYTNYNTFCNEVSGVLVPLTTSAEDGYNWAKRDLIEKAITPKTKAICCLSPGNPTGRVLTLEDMRLIGDIAKEHDLWIISDEVYREFVYDGAEAHSFGQLEDIADRVVIVDSVSKRWSACGARIGAAISKNEEFMSALLNPGDEALIAEPFYTNYNTFCNEVSGKLVPLTTSAEDGYDWAKRDLIEAAITPKTKAICCLSPGNPTGRVLTLEDMKLIGDIAKEHDLWIISDEVYREFVYDGAEAHSFGQLDDIADRVVIVDSVSKRWSACGARVGAAISKNKDFMSALLKLAQGRLCVPTLEQVGAA
ncbi:MAG: aminotransferase class I/II-fold pyridoxal phosphate-dependent enzyme, partial [Mogibacterium sp.]|nr:aminotransferase class I/II-fold pyridoxal phosphate-dependent enzyme [Mogibacterium sp.]